MALAVALSQCLEATEGRAEVALVQAAPIAAMTIGVTEITEWSLKFVILMWILSLVCTAWCTWKASGLWGAWNAPKTLKSTADKSVQSQTTYKWWITNPRFVPLA